MLHINSAKFRQLAVLAFGLLVIALAVFAQAQNKKEDSKLTLKDAVARVSDSSGRLKDTSKFEIVKKGKGQAVVRFVTDRKVVGTVGCGVCPGEACDMLLEGGGGFSCHGCGGHKDCTLNPF